jgi:tight adherence protein B
VTDSPEAAIALRGLAGLMRSGLSMRAALSAWPDHAPPEMAPALTAIARRLALGQRPSDAVAGLEDALGDGAASLWSIVSVHLATGCDAAALLDAAADELDRRWAQLRSARAAASGPKLSGKLVAALPLSFIPMLPAGGAWRFDRRGCLLLVAGAGLLLAGMWWIARLLPRPPPPDGASDLAEMIAPALEAGLSMPDALELCSASVGAEVRRESELCRRRVRLGAGWARALGMSPDPGLVALAATVRRSETLGAPVGSALRAFARQRRSQSDIAFERAARRAPVLMVLPLVLCVLPSFVLLALAPFLRALSFHP